LSTYHPLSAISYQQNAESETLEVSQDGD